MSLFDDASLVLIPDGAKDGTLYSVKPTDGTGDFTFTRGSNLAATRVDENGLIEKGRENLLLQSNQFDTTWVQFQGSSVTSGQEGYDGSSNAWKLNVVNTQLYSGLYQVISGSYVGTQSIYAKAGTLDHIGFVNMSGSGFSAWFDLTNGTIGTQGGSNIDASIESVGNGWYRLSVTQSGAKSYFQIKPSDSENLPSSSNGYIYIQDAQLEAGLVATDYIETGATTAQAGILEDLPRIDYSGGASCPALLLEPQRTNLITNSEYFGTWTGSTYITSNYAISPDGSQNASRCLFTGSNQVLTITSSLSTGVSCSATIYVKGTSGETIRLAAGGVDTMHTLNGDWQRIETNATSINSTFVLNTFGGATARDLLIFGAQLEEGSYPTSYIPTYGSSVTRSADVPNISSGSSIFNDSEGTFYVEIEGLSDTASTKVITIGDGTSSNRVQIFYQSGTNITTNVISGGSAQVSGFTTSATQTDNNKVLIRYASNNAKMYLNGTEIASDTSVTPPSGLNVLRFDNGVGAALFEGEVKQLLYFPTALTDAECIALTTL
jgi:hypothetical protein